MDRRTFLSLSAGAATVPLVGHPALAQDAPARTSPANSPPDDKLAQAIASSAMPLLFDGKRFSGAGYDWLRHRGSEAQAFLLGEEHGIAENPKLAAQLFTDLTPRGYRHVAVEISPPMAVAVDRALASADPNQGLHGRSSEHQRLPQDREHELLQRQCGGRRSRLWSCDGCLRQ